MAQERIGVLQLQPHGFPILSAAAIISVAERRIDVLAKSSKE
jgi:hypothetical protein